MCLGLGDGALRWWLLPPRADDTALQVSLWRRMWFIVGEASSATVCDQSSELKWNPPVSTQSGFCLYLFIAQAPTPDIFFSSFLGPASHTMTEFFLWDYNVHVILQSKYSAGTLIQTSLSVTSHITTNTTSKRKTSFNQTGNIKETPIHVFVLAVHLCTCGSEILNA